MPYLRVGEREMLFNKYSVLDVLPSQKQKLKAKIQSFKADYLLNASEQDLVASLVEESTLTVPTIDESNIQMDYREKQIDVSGDPNRMFFDHHGPFYVAGTEFTFMLPFAGDAAFFDVQPQNFTYSSSGSRAVVHNNEIHFTYAATNLNPDGAKREFQNELQVIEQNLQNLKSAVVRHNSELEREIRQQVTQRKQKLLNDAHMASSLGYPIRRREGAPTTYAVPVQRRTSKIAPPPASSLSFKPEPAARATFVRTCRTLGNRSAIRWGMSMPRQARSGGLFPNIAGRSTIPTVVVKDGNSTLNATHPARHPSTPATNIE
jgi:hypothetical protein